MVGRYLRVWITRVMPLPSVLYPGYASPIGVIPGVVPQRVDNPGWYLSVLITRVCRSPRVLYPGMPLSPCVIPGLVYISPLLTRVGVHLTVVNPGMLLTVCYTRVCCSPCVIPVCVAQCVPLSVCTSFRVYISLSVHNGEYLSSDDGRKVCTTGIGLPPMMGERCAQR